MYQMVKLRKYTILRGKKSILGEEFVAFLFDI